jgi:hypothetical protein
MTRMDSWDRELERTRARKFQLVSRALVPFIKDSLHNIYASKHLGKKKV